MRVVISTLMGLVLGGLLLGGAWGCTPTTQIVESWKDPSVTAPLHSKKVLVIVVHPDAHTRKVAEDQLVKQIGPERAVRGDDVLTDADREDIAKVKAKVKQSGVDSVVTMRVVGSTTRTSWSRGFDPYSYDSFWQDYDRNMSARSGGTPYTERLVMIRTRIYTVADEKLVWAGVSESFEPTDTRSLIGEIAKAVGAKLREEHVIE